MVQELFMTVPFNVSTELLFCSTVSPEASRVSRWLCLDAAVTRGWSSAPQGWAVSENTEQGLSKHTQLTV